MKILIINQYGPPDTSPTARLVGDLTDFLKTEGHEVRVVASSTEASGYRKRYRGALRILVEGYACLVLMLKAILAGSPDRIIVFSSPPMVLLAAVCAARYHRAPVVHWVLDAYPDVAFALGGGGPEFVQKALRSVMRQAYRDCQQVVAVSGAMQQMLRERYGIESHIISPWPQHVPASDMNHTWKGVPDGYGVWCYSGNLGKAHEWSVLLDVQQELEERQVPLALVVQGGGDGWQKLQQEARNRGIRNIILRDYVKTEALVASLHAALVRVATLKAEMSGLLWPSKWAMIDCLPGPHLWIGPKRDLGHGMNKRVGRFDVEHYGSIADWLGEKLCETSTRPEWSPEAFKESVDRKRSEGLNQWRSLLENSLE